MAADVFNILNLFAEIQYNYHKSLKTNTKLIQIVIVIMLIIKVYETT